MNELTNPTSNKNCCQKNKMKDFVYINCKNVSMSFKINISVKKTDSIPTEFQPKAFYFPLHDEIILIYFELLDYKMPYYYNSYEQVDVSEKYMESYTISELNNYIGGCEFYTKLSEFKDAILKGLNSNKYELYIIKNLLLLNVRILNIFGDEKVAYFVIRPYKNDLKENLSQNKIDKNLFKSEPNKQKNSILGKETRMLGRKKKFTNVIGKSILYNDDNKNNIIDETNSFLNSLNGPNTNCPSEIEYDNLINISTIIKNKEEENLISDMISCVKNKKFRLLFMATKNGDSASKFHAMCDSFTNLIILVKTKQGNRFGGYTSTKFGGTSHVKVDNNAFLFSLDKKKIFKIISGSYAIYCYENSGPCFCQSSLNIPNHFFRKNGKTCVSGGPFQFSEKYELNNGQEKFLVQELEVFHVIIEN